MPDSFDVKRMLMNKEITEIERVVGILRLANNENMSDEPLSYMASNFSVMVASAFQRMQDVLSMPRNSDMFRLKQKEFCLQLLKDAEIINDKGELNEFYTEGYGPSSPE